MSLLPVWKHGHYLVVLFSLKLLSPETIPGFHFLSNAYAEYKLTPLY